MNEKQLLLLVSEKTKAKQNGKKVLWDGIAKILKDEGPCIKSADRWRDVRIRLDRLAF